ncbi:MAG TPA: hypothetical protein VIY51_14190 [Xanthobacteraceae bacterium]
MALALALPVVIVLQVIFVFSLAAVRGQTDLAAVNDAVRVAFDRGVLATNQVPKPWILRGGHQFTECVGLSVALDPQRDVWQAALATKMHSRMIDPCSELYRSVRGENTELMDYSRYWHGYRLLLWPVLAHSDVLVLRVITALLVAGGVALFFVGLRGTIGSTPTIIIVATMFLLTDLWHIWRIATHGLSMFVILGGAGAFALLLRLSANQYLWIVSAAALGAVFNFVDFLINPPMMPMLLSFIVLAFVPQFRRDGQRDGVRPLALAMTVAASWFLGYAGTWGTKWVLAIWFSNNAMEEAANIVNQVTFRLDGLEPGSTMFRVPLVPTISMILKAFESVGAILVVPIIAAVLIHVRDNHKSFDRAYFYQLTLPVSITLLWFELLSNHTQLHPNFVYRSASTAIALVLAAGIISSNAPVSAASLWINLRRFVAPAGVPA